jgi:DNA-binding transcriptional ArsR family regulator
MPTKTQHDQAWAFAGFTSPTTTAVPDQFFDDLMPRLSEAELRCLLYIFRRTFGFKKDSDSISFKQLVDGIRTRDGRVLDRGTGLAKSAVARGLNGLKEKGIIRAQRNQSAAKGNEPTTYSLRFQPAPLSSKETRGGPPAGQALVLQKDTQHTVLQQTVLSSTIERGNTQNADHEGRGSERSPAPAAASPGFASLQSVLSRRAQRPAKGADDRQVIQSYLADVARELGDHATLHASTTRALRLLRQSGLGHEAFVGKLFEAKALTKDTVQHGRTPVRNRMAYFFTVLADLLGIGSTHHREIRKGIGEETATPLVARAPDVLSEAEEG